MSPVYGLPPGADFGQALVAGLAARLAGQPPEAWARVTILVNSGRMGRRLREVLTAGPARLLPRIRVLADLGSDAGFPDIPPARPALHLRLDLAELLGALIARQPDLAPPSSVHDLAESLAALMDEMAGEGVDPDRLAQLDMAGFAGHWQRALAIVSAAEAHFARDPDTLPGAEARRRRVVQALAQRWRDAPPQDPVIVAGSTGSRGTTLLLMQAVAALPQGALVLPGFDFDQGAEGWQALARAPAAEDHPQYRYHLLMSRLGLSPGDVRPWHAAAPPEPARNRLVSLALCPAPVTDRWREEGARLGDPGPACAGLTLLEAPSPRAEAQALALRLRAAVAAGQRAALITPDRGLTRMVAAALDRWGILPDDSAGEPLHQTPAGRMLCQVAEALASPPDLPGFLALMKAPLAATGGARGDHLRQTRNLELWLRRHGVLWPDAACLAGRAERARGDAGPWLAWAAGWMAGLAGPATAPLPVWLAQLRHLTETLAAGQGGTPPGTLWEEPAGQAAARALADLEGAGDLGGAMTPLAFARLVRAHLGAQAVQDPRLPHRDVMIWGTLEARVQGADLVLLAGLNDGTWPDLPPPDPWLNRRMRAEAGLLAPERRIGLAAHDFQQAIGAGQVVLSRALRDEEAETVPSRWLSRLVNLLGGLGAPGQAALAAMRGRGGDLLVQADLLDRPAASVARAPRPSPRPPVALRPRELPVTAITTLIRDPYAVYARHVLRLYPLAPLMPPLDARMRGTVLHRIMAAFVEDRAAWGDDPAAALARVSAAVLARDVPRPALQRQWQARLMAVSERLLAGEVERLAAGAPVVTDDRQGRLALPGLGFVLTARPDRIDDLGGAYAIYDYKSGMPPTARQVQTLEKQLPLEAAMLERGGFEGICGPVTRLGYVALGVSGKDVDIPLEQEDGQRLPDATWAELHRLIARYQDPAQGYTARRAVERVRFAGDYDHLARMGEWDLGDPPDPDGALT